MSRSYEVLIHVTFQRQARELTAGNPDLEGPLVTALEEIKADPTPGTMQAVTVRRLQGVIHKKHVGGRGGHRLIYLHPKGSNIIIPVYLSPEEKSNFSYDKIDWQGMCDEFFKDFTNNNSKSFMNWKGKSK